MSEPHVMCPGCERAWSECGCPFTTKCLMAWSFNRGMREGVAMAKEHAFAEEEGGWRDAYHVVNWSDVDAELARRVGGE